MAHYWLRIAGRGRRHLPGVVDGFIRHAAQFRYPMTDVVSILVKSFALQDRIKDTKKGLGIGSRSSRPLPAAIVDRLIAIEPSAA